MKIEKYSIGIGDRFACQGSAQLLAIIQGKKCGLDLTPVWNKSNREHLIVKSAQASVRREADGAVAALGWTGPYRVDADHINLSTVDGFLEACDFYTIDVADSIGKVTEKDEMEKFILESRRFLGEISLPGVAGPQVIDEAALVCAARRFFGAMREAARIYRHIAKRKGNDFIAEISVDEAEVAQTPTELLLILAMLAREKVPCQTIAPKFTGRFNKGVDYVGDLLRFEKEFEENLGVVRFAVREMEFPESLKLSIHSGSDKFSLYPIINRQLKKHDAGVHVKTAGTTWLEEIIGLAEAGGEGLSLAREIYAQAHARFDELVAPYATVLDIDPARLPAPAEVNSWESARFCAALRHDPCVAEYNPHFRQLLHVAFKIAAEMGPRYLDALRTHQSIIARNVTQNLFDRHIIPLFNSGSNASAGQAGDFN